MNKQRITMLSEREKQAAVTSGALDLEIPDAAIRQRLENEPRTFDTEAVLTELARKVAYERLRQSRPRLKPSQISDQAAATVAVIDELVNRVNHMHPSLEAVVNEILMRTQGEFVYQLSDRIAPDLYGLRSGLNVAIQMNKNEPVPTGPKGARKALKESVADILRRHSDPPISNLESKAVAVELLELCEIQLRPKRKA